MYDDIRGKQGEIKGSDIEDSVREIVGFGSRTMVVEARREKEIENEQIPGTSEQGSETKQRERERESARGRSWR